MVNINFNAIVFHCLGIFNTGRHVVCGLYLCGDDAAETSLPGKGRNRPTQSDL